MTTSRLSLINGLIAALAVIAAMAAGWHGTSARQINGSSTSSIDTVIDAHGQRLAVRPYQRIVSTCLVGDQALLALVEPERVIAITTWSAARRDGYRYGARAQVQGLDQPEAILALRPDLVVVSGSDPRSRLIADAGIPIIDIGPMRGLASFQACLRLLGTATAQHQRGELLATGIGSRMATLATATTPPLRAIYVGIHAQRLYGGTANTSFHDVLTAAGLRDAAAEAGFSDWPEYDAERLLQLDPDLLITRTGMTPALRTMPGLDHLRARIIELDGELLDDPGFGMVDAAAQLVRAVQNQR